MTFAFLPNYFKRIGIICFLISIGITITATIIIAAEALSYYGQESEFMTYKFGYEMGRELANQNIWIGKLSSILLMLSMAVYMLAKEKVDDEYIDVIRWESLRFSIIISIIFTFVCILLNWKLPAKTILFMQFTAYLITFKVKKSTTGKGE